MAQAREIALTLGESMKTQEQLAFIQEINGGESIQLKAVAGSGKTTTLLWGLEASETPAEETLLLAFNKKIQEELARRAPKGTVVLTLNGLGHRAWKKHIGKNPFLDAKKVGTLVSDLCKDPTSRERDEYLRALWPDIKDLVNKAKGVGLLPKQFNSGKGLVHDSDSEWNRLADMHNINISDDILRLARKALIQSTTLALGGQIDFDDQLYMPACFRSNLDKYKLVLVDEAQDLSEIQHFLIARTVANGGRLIAVGDPHQAIYGFRGALSDSMEALGNRFTAKELSLTYTFRCSKEATKLAQKYVPQLKAADGNLQGSVENLGTEWSPKDIAPGSVILCRNIAPLVKLGMHCIKTGVSAYVAGRDIGAPLIKACKQINPLMNIHDAIILWSKEEQAKAKGNLETKSRINDTTDALLAVMEISNAKSSRDLEDTLRLLFSKTEGSIVLSTIHRAKGLEWNSVYILDFWRMPQKWILRAIKESPDAAWMLQQEHNLAYIAITRTKDKLTFIDYPQMEEQNAA